MPPDTSTWEEIEVVAHVQQGKLRQASKWTVQKTDAGVGEIKGNYFPRRPKA